MGICPRWSMAILPASMSQQVTSLPMSANPAPATSPTYPVPMTHIFMTAREANTAALPRKVGVIEPGQMTGPASFSVTLAVLLLTGAVAAAPKSLGVVGRVSVEGGVINDAFALDDSGRTLAWVETTGAGAVRMHIAPVTSGWSGTTVDLTDFTVTPERIHFLGGQWIVVASEGERRAAAVVSGSKLGARIGPFGEGLVSAVGGKKFVTVTERNEPAGRRFTIAAYRPGGGLLAQKQLAVGPEGDIAGKGLGFIGFTSGYLQALVKKPGA